MRRRKRAWQRSDAASYAERWMHADGLGSDPRIHPRDRLPELVRWTPADDWDRRALPREVDALIHAANRWIQAFEDCGKRLVAQCVAADFADVARMLLAIRDADWLPGNRFLELGSGYGVVTMLASMMGMDAVGIEANASLVRRSREFAEAHSIDVEFIVGDFVPADFAADGVERDSPTLSHRTGQLTDGCPVDWDDYALLYSYPWPGEHELHERMIRRYARPRAGYIQYRGPADVVVVTVDRLR